jgi:Fe-S-cluster containining protein
LRFRNAKLCVIGYYKTMTSVPWYHQGLRFQCTGCGDCCTGAPGYVWINKAEIGAMSCVLRISAAEFEKRYVRQVGIRKSLVELPNGDCVFFDSDRRCCQIYEVRPRQCRTWPFWASNLSSPQSWREVADRCPGCNRGQIVPVEEIQRQKI